MKQQRFQLEVNKKKRNRAKSSSGMWKNLAHEGKKKRKEL